MLKYTFLLFVFSIHTCVLFGQSSREDSIAVASKIIKEWLIDLNQNGLEIRGDSLIVSQEVLKLMDDEAYRKTLYPEVYTWESAVQFIQREELKQAFWYFINLYPLGPKNKELVLKSVLTYDRLFKMDKLLTSTFYTYSFLDPEIGEFVDGKPEITRPDILDKKLNTVNEINQYIRYYRQKNSEKK